MACFSNTKSFAEPLILLLLGLDNAGKTSVLLRIKKEPADRISRTTWGFSTETVPVNTGFCRNEMVTIYDVGGGPKIRGIWPNYYAECHGIIFVVDSSDFNRIAEVSKTLEETISDERIKDKPILILSNKSDRKSYKLEKLEKLLNLNKLFPDFNAKTQNCSVHMESTIGVSRNGPDSGLSAGLRWLINKIKMDYKILSPRIAKDVRLQKERYQRESIEKRQKIANLAKKEEEAKTDIKDEIILKKNKNSSFELLLQYDTKMLMDETENAEDTMRLAISAPLPSGPGSSIFNQQNSDPDMNDAQKENLPEDDSIFVGTTLDDRQCDGVSLAAQLATLPPDFEENSEKYSPSSIKKLKLDTFVVHSASLKNIEMHQSDTVPKWATKNTYIKEKEKAKTEAEQEAQLSNSLPRASVLRQLEEIANITEPENKNDNESSCLTLNETTCSPPALETSVISIRKSKRIAPEPLNQELQTKPPTPPSNPPPKTTLFSARKKLNKNKICPEQTSDETLISPAQSIDTSMKKLPTQSIETSMKKLVLLNPIGTTSSLPPLLPPIGKINKLGA